MSRFGVGCRTPLGGSYRSPLGALACPGGCPSELEVTFSGVDASICACGNIPFSLNSVSFSSPAVDGTFATPLSVDSDPTCTYVGSYSPAPNPVVRATWHSGLGCPGGSESPYTAAILSVTLVSGKVTNINFSQGTGVSGVAVFKWSGNADLGDALANQWSCGGAVAFDGGTATVVKA